MSNKQKNKSPIKKLFSLFCTIATLLFFLILLSTIRKNTAVADFFTKYISRPLVFAMGSITSIFSFSIFEIFVMLAIIAGITLLVLGIIKLCKKRFYIVIKGFCIVMVVVLSLLNWYTLTAGFAYYRSELELPSVEAHYDGAEFVAMGNYFMDDFIYLDTKMQRDDNGDVISPYTTKELTKLLQEEYKRLDNGYLFSFTPRAKPLLNSWLMSSTGYAGVAFLPFGEAQYNGLMPRTDSVQTIAHELAHTKGVMRENEANLVSYYILLSSENEYLRYCGYFSTFYTVNSFIALGNNNDWDLADTVTDRLPQTISKEYSNAFAYWLNYKGPFDWLGNWFSTIGDKFNEWYLKINGSDEGLGSYDNPWDYEDSGEVDPETEEPIFIPIYSNIHKLYFALYDQRK